MAIFFFVWLFIAGFAPENGGPKYFIYLTNWANLLWSGYLIWAAIFMTATYFQVVYFLLSGRDVNHGHEEDHCAYQLLVDDKPAGCCGADGDQSFWYQKISWLLFTIGSGTIVGISVLYWTLDYDPGVDLGYDPFGGVNIVTHLVAGIVGVVEVWLTGVPMRLLHLVYLMAFGAAYAVFTGIYYAAGGTNASNQPYIYSFVDYGERPGSSAAIVIVLVLVYLPMVYLLLYAQFLLREAALYLKNRYCCQKLSSADDSLIGMERIS